MLEIYLLYTHKNPFIYYPNIISTTGFSNSSLTVKPFLLKILSSLLLQYSNKLTTKMRCYLMNYILTYFLFLVLIHELKDITDIKLQNIQIYWKKAERIYLSINIFSDITEISIQGEGGPSIFESLVYVMIKLQKISNFS